MNGGMGKRMEDWVGGWMNGWIDGLMNEIMKRSEQKDWMLGRWQMYGWVDECLCLWVCGLVDGFMTRLQMDGTLDLQVKGFVDD